MGVDYDPVLMIGAEFDSTEEAEEFLRANGIELPDDESDEMEDGLGEYLDGNDVHGLHWERFNYYSSWDGGCLGFSPSVRDIDKFADQVREMQGKWKELFGTDAEIIHTVKVW